MSSYTKSISHVSTHGALLVFPVKNKKLPLSLWACLHPRTTMRWEWDDDGDSKVFDLWKLREKLSKSGRVVYGKFYKGRATLFSLEVFKNILALKKIDQLRSRYKHGPEADILSCLEDSSPLSTKQIKKLCGLQGRFQEPNYARAMKNLWNDFLIVGWGELDEGAFPSLQIGVVTHLFEQIYKDSKSIPESQAKSFLQRKLGQDSLFC